MTREKFASQLAKELHNLGMSKMNRQKAEKLIAAITESLTFGLANDRKAIVSNFGSFEVVKYGAKIINSPRGDKKQFFMPPTDVIKWHPSGKVRTRAASEEVAPEEYQKLVGNPRYEIEPPTVFIQKEKEISPPPSAKTANPFEVHVRVQNKRQSHILDDNSPISKFVKSIFRLMQTFGADKLEIVPNRNKSELVYFSGSEEKNHRYLPKESHAVIIEKIEALAGPSDELLLFGTDRIKMSKRLTKFGNQLTICKI